MKGNFMKIINNIKSKDFMSFLSLQKTIYTNFYYSKELMLEIFDKNNVFLNIKENWVILVNYGDFNKLYFYILDSISEDEFEKIIYEINNLIKEENVFVVAEYVNKDEKENIYINNLLKKLNMDFFIRRERMAYKYSEDYNDYIEVFEDNYKNIKNQNKVFIEVANENDLKGILYLLENAFDPYSSLIPSEDELREIIKNNDIFVARSVNDPNSLLGFIEFKEERRKNYLAHAVVDEKYRGMSIGKILVEFYLLNGSLKNEKDSYLWVQSNNDIAKNMYEKYKFKYEEIYANVYISKGERI